MPRSAEQDKATHVAVLHVRLSRLHGGVALRLFSALFFLVLSGVSILIGWGAYQNYRGFSADTGMHLADNEIVEIAAKYVTSADDEFLMFVQENQILGFSKSSVLDEANNTSGRYPCCSIPPWETLRG